MVKQKDPSHRRRTVSLFVVLVVALMTFAVTFVLVSIFEHRQHATQPYVRIVEVNEVSTDPVPWGVRMNFILRSRHYNFQM